MTDMGFRMPEIHLWTPWVLSAVSLASPWLVGKHRRSGWIVGIVSSVLCVAYNIITAQYGFIPQNVFAAVICMSNYHKWGRMVPGACVCDDRRLNGQAHREDEAAHQTTA